MLCSGLALVEWSKALEAAQEELESHRGSNSDQPLFARPFARLASFDVEVHPDAADSGFEVAVEEVEVEAAAAVVAVAGVGVAAADDPAVYSFATYGAVPTLQQYSKVDLHSCQRIPLAPSRGEFPLVMTPEACSALSYAALIVDLPVVFSPPLVCACPLLLLHAASSALTHPLLAIVLEVQAAGQVVDPMIDW